MKKSKIFISLSSLIAFSFCFPTYSCAETLEDKSISSTYHHIKHFNQNKVVYQNKLFADGAQQDTSATTLSLDFPAAVAGSSILSGTSATIVVVVTIVSVTTIGINTNESYTPAVDPITGKWIIGLNTPLANGDVITVTQSDGKTLTYTVGGSSNLNDTQAPSGENTTQVPTENTTQAPNENITQAPNENITQVLNENTTILPPPPPRAE